MELGLRVRRDANTNTAMVSFLSMQIRESGKQANFLLGGMDLAANGIHVDAFLQPGGQMLMCSLLQGAVRHVRNWYLRQVLFGMLPYGSLLSQAQLKPKHIMEIGGGRGGDASAWCNAASVCAVDVIEPNRWYMCPRHAPPTQTWMRCKSIDTGC